jgi:hypothetical protein
MHTRATGSRSSTPAPRTVSGPGRAPFAAEPTHPERPDFDTWLRNADAFGHHFADLPAPGTQPIQRRRREEGSAQPYSLPAGLPMNALRAPSGSAPIQGFGIPEWMKKVGRGVGGLASGAWNLMSSSCRRGSCRRGGNNQNAPAAEDEQPLVEPPRRRERRRDVSPAEARLEPLVRDPVPSRSVPARAVPRDNGVGLGLGPPPPSATPEIVPPSFEELERQREAASRAYRRGQPRSSASSSSPATSSALSSDEEAAIRAKARANSAKLTGHGRAAHGTKGLARPASQVASNSSRSQQRAEDRTVEQAQKAKAKKKEKEKEK